MMRRTLRKYLAHILNSIADLLPPDPLSNRLRPFLLRPLGLRCHYSSAISSGTYINPGDLSVAERCFINQGCFFDLTAPITIADNVVVGMQTLFVTAHHEIGGPQRRCGAVKGKPIVVEAGAWIGARATILGGVTIGTGAVVAAGSIVIHDVPPHALVAGVPAKLVRSLNVNTTDAVNDEQQTPSSQSLTALDRDG